MQREYNIGDIVLYAAHGCCEVEDIEMRDTGIYYVLHPLKRLRTRFYVPADNQELMAKVRPLPTPKALEETIDQVASSEPEWIEDVSVRRDTAREVLASGDEHDVLMLLRGFHNQKKQAAGSGKRLLTSDASILRAVQDHVRDEFSLVLDIEPHEVDQLLADRMGHGQ